MDLLLLPGLKAGEAPVVKVDFVEPGIAAIGKPVNDFGVGSAGREQTVKVILDVLGQATGFAPGFSALSLNGASRGLRVPGSRFRVGKC